MNVICLTLISFFSLAMHAQKFEFNLLTKYSTKTEDSYFENVVYSNSTNDSYFLYIERLPELKNATLYDLENMTMHKFEVIDSKISNKLFFEFNYIKSNTIVLKMNIENSY